MIRRWEEMDYDVAQTLLLVAILGFMIGRHICGR